MRTVIIVINKPNKNEDGYVVEKELLFWYSEYWVQRMYMEGEFEDLG